LFVSHLCFLAHAWHIFSYGKLRTYKLTIAMKNISLNRILTAALLIVFTVLVGANAYSAIQEENKDEIRPTELYLDKVNIEDVFCQNANPNQVFIILDQNDRIITQGKCNDVMVKFFLRISDPLLQIEDIKYFRLGYENHVTIENRLVLKE